MIITPSPDFIILTETWLRRETADTELGLHNYTIHRQDRSTSSSVRSRGGGVLIANKKYLHVPPVFTSIMSIEHCFVKSHI